MIGRNIERRETGTLAAQEDDRLSLLPSGPDEVHGSPLRETHLPPLNLTIDDFWIKKWRRERDSNPRYSFPYTRFPGVLLQPLGHLSIVLSKRSYVVLAHLCNEIILLDSALFVKQFFLCIVIFFRRWRCNQSSRLPTTSPIDKNRLNSTMNITNNTSIYLYTSHAVHGARAGSSPRHSSCFVLVSSS